MEARSEHELVTVGRPHARLRAAAGRRRRPAPVALPGSVTVKGPGYTGRFRTVLRELERAPHPPRGVRRSRRRVLAAAALRAGADDRRTRAPSAACASVELSLVTPEEEPLELFGPAASEAVPGTAGRARHRAPHAGAIRPPSAGRAGDRSRRLDRRRPRGEPAAAARPVPAGPAARRGGLHPDRPARARRRRGGRLRRRRRDHLRRSSRAGSPPSRRTPPPRRSRRAPARDVEPRPFRPVLRGLLLTGGEPRYMRAEVSGSRRRRRRALSEHALWWPPSKIAGRWLAPYLAANTTSSSRRTASRSTPMPAQVTRRTQAAPTRPASGVAQPRHRAGAGAGSSARTVVPAPGTSRSTRRPADQLDALVHPDQPEAAAGVPGSKPDAVVADEHPQRVAVLHELDQTPRAAPRA